MWINSWNKYSQHTTNFAVISQITRQCKYDQQRLTTCLIKSRICLLDLRDAPNCEFEAIRQHVRNMKPHMLTAQYNDDNSNDDSIRALCEQQANQGGYFLLNLRSCPKEQDPTWDISLGICTNLPGLIRSFAETGEELHLHFDSAKRVAEAAVESAIARFQRTGSARRWDGTFFTTWSTPLIGNLSKVDRKKAEQINHELKKKVCQTFQTEAAIDLACDQDQVLREHFPQTARSHREEILPPDMEEIYEPRHLVQEEDEDHETETARPLSEREKRELFRQHRNLGHPQPTELARALRHAGARTGSCTVCSQRVTLSNVRSTTPAASTPSRNVATLSTF